MGLEVPEDDIKRTMKGLAERNKMTEEQFAQHLKGMGVDVSTMRERFRAQYAWREWSGAGSRRKSPSPTAMSTG